MNVSTERYLLQICSATENEAKAILEAKFSLGVASLNSLVNNLYLAD
jgi:hypothetical protein